MHLPGLHDSRRIGAAVKLVDLVAHRFAEIGIASLLSLVCQRGHVGFFAELDGDLATGVLQEALSATAGNLLEVEAFVESSLQQRDTGQHVVVFRAFAEQDNAARVYRFSAHRTDKGSSPTGCSLKLNIFGWPNVSD
jgi:hypothetical protein